MPFQRTLLQMTKYGLILPSENHTLYSEIDRENNFKRQIRLKSALK